jgi:hypothetical protein
VGAFSGFSVQVLIRLRFAAPHCGLFPAIPSAVSPKLIFLAMDLQSYLFFSFAATKISGRWPSHYRVAVWGYKDFGALPHGLCKARINHFR